MSAVAGEALELLEAERQLLVEGRLDALEPLVAMKEALSERLRVDSPPEAVIRRLRHAGERNAGLLAAARRGLRTAASQLAEARSASIGTTYAQDGSRISLPRGGTALEKKI